MILINARHFYHFTSYYTKKTRHINKWSRYVHFKVIVWQYGELLRCPACWDPSHRPADFLIDKTNHVYRLHFRMYSLFQPNEYIFKSNLYNCFYQWKTIVQEGVYMPSRPRLVALRHWFSWQLQHFDRNTSWHTFCGYYLLTYLHQLWRPSGYGIHLKTGRSKVRIPNWHGQLVSHQLVK